MSRVATVGGVALHGTDETLQPSELRQRACTELLRQAAIALGLLARDDPCSTDAGPSAAAVQAIETLLDREVQVPQPDVAACRRHYLAQQARYRRGECIEARHILFAVTPGVDVARLRRRAEQALLEARSAGADDDGCFARLARELSNCPSGAAGGALGWLTPEACVPELAGELFGRDEVGVLARVLRSRFGLHVFEVTARDPGTVPAFEEVQAAVALTLHQQAWATALRQYLRVLAGAADITGVDLDGSATPLVQ